MLSVSQTTPFFFLPLLQLFNVYVLYLISATGSAFPASEESSDAATEVTGDVLESVGLDPSTAEKTDEIETDGTEQTQETDQTEKTEQIQESGQIEEAGQIEEMEKTEIEETKTEEIDQTKETKTEETRGTSQSLLDLLQQLVVVINV